MRYEHLRAAVRVLGVLRVAFDARLTVARPNTLNPNPQNGPKLREARDRSCLGLFGDIELSLA